MPSNNHLARIHILKKEAGLDEDQYRTLLAAFGAPLNDEGKPSSAGFSNDQARRFASFLEDYIYRNSDKEKDIPGWGKNKYEYLRGRPGDFAEPQQLRMIEAIWREVARNPSDKALMKMVRRVTKTDIQKIIWLKKKHVEPMAIALKDMKKRSIENRNKKKTTHG